ncbi:hypothetical protein [Kitasatospora sp. NPDC059827]|uniref:hypothetical protein n=1 Tax=Kitasatospora sp. NPDC059827 TaxID=3346964 RepID=UPI0036576E63
MMLGVGVRGVKAASVVGTSVLLVGALAGCGDGSRSPAGASAASSSSASAAPGSLRLTAPDSLPGGYRAKGPADVRESDPASPQPQPTGYKSFDGALVARYTTDTGGVMMIGGAWGTVSDPGAVVASAVAATQGPRGNWSVPQSDVDALDPHDPHGRLTCGAWTESLLTTPMCFWADHSTAGSVSFTPSPQGSPATLDQTTAAEHTRRIRDAMTAPTGVGADH